MRCQTRRLRHHGAVDVANLKALRPHAPRRFGQQHDRVGTAKRGVGVRKMRANIAQRRRAQQRIGDGVQQHIGIGMAQQAGAVGDTHTAQHQRAPGHQCVNVPAFANSEIHLKSLLNGQPLRIKK